MKIQVRGSDHNIRIALPTALVLNRHILKLALGNMKVDGVKLNGLSRQQANSLSAEIRRIKRKHGSWTLVEVQSTDGEEVTITI